jgi:UDP-GlcNAc:undecaprenyl-phosphate GlcNAc-1-phosphate transferase
LTNFYLIIASSVFFFVIYLNKNLIAKRLSLFDLPDKKLKIHKENTPLLGGIVFIIISAIIIMHLIYTKNFTYIKILFLASVMSVVGLFDDIYKLKPNFKFFLITLIIFVYIIFFQELKIQSITFSNNIFIKEFNLENKNLLGIFITILCYQLLINAFNMTDGHDGISCLIAITWFVYFYINKNNLDFLPAIIVTLLLFLYFNLKSKIFLGDSGNYFLSTLFGSLIIFDNNISKNFIAEEIFILLMLPGIDMMRLFYQRITNDKNPLTGDRRHLHHLLFFHYNKTKTILIYFLLFIFPIVLLYFKILSENYIILSFLIIYISILFYFSKE